MRTYYRLGFIAVFVVVATACGNAHPLRGPSQATDAPGDFTGDDGSPAVSRDAIDDAGGESTSVERPIARLSVPSLVNAGDEIALDGEGSTAAGGAALAYAWRITPVENDGRFSLRDETKAMAAARFLTRGRYRVTLVVTANGVDSATAEAEIDADDTSVRPIASAGADQDVVVGTVVSLDGAGSHDPNGDSLSYDWTILEGGALPGFDVHAKSPRFSAALPHATYRFSLVVKDGMHASQNDEVVVRVKNSPPELSGIVDHPVHLKTVPLEVTATDKDGDALTYAWDFVAKPQGSTATILDPAARETSFVVDVLGTYDVRVKVSDGRAESVAVMRVTPYNAAPGISDGMATPAEMPHNCAGNRCTATATLSVNVVDADDRDLLVAFNLKKAPNAQVVATFCTAPTKPPTSSRAGWTNIVCDVTLATEGRAANDPAPGIAGNYVFEAKVTDSFGESRSLEIAALVKNDAPTVTVSGATTVNYQARRDAQNASRWELTATASFSATATDPENGLKSTRWSIVKQPQDVTVRLSTLTESAQTVSISVATSDVAILKRLVSTDYELEFQATDINDATATQRISFAIVDRPLVWNGVDGATTAPHKTTVNGNVATITTSYDLKAKVTDLDGRIASYNWTSGGRSFGSSQMPNGTMVFTFTKPAIGRVQQADLASDVVVTATDFKGDGLTSPAIALMVGNESPRIAPVPSVQNMTYRRCVPMGLRHQCWTDVVLSAHGAQDADGDPLDVRYAVDAVPGRSFTVVWASGVLQIVESGTFRFGAAPYEGSVTLNMTAVDFFGAAATFAIPVIILNRPPPSPTSTIAAENQWFACGAGECHAIMTGDAIADYASSPVSNDGDELRAVGTGYEPGVTFARKSGKFFGCEPTQTCFLGVCRDNFAQWRQSAAVAFSSRWVVSYPATAIPPRAVAAQAEDWSGKLSGAVFIAVSIVDGGNTPGCAPRIEWSSPKADEYDMDFTGKI